DGRRRPHRDAAPRRRAADRAGRVAAHRFGRPRRARRAHRLVHRPGTPAPRVPRPGARPGGVPADVRRRDPAAPAREVRRVMAAGSARWIVVVPVKRATDGKSRLDVAGTDRAALAHAIALDTLEAATACELVAQVVV